jgi:hypothetical protein
VEDVRGVVQPTALPFWRAWEDAFRLNAVLPELDCLLVLAYVLAIAQPYRRAADKAWCVLPDRPHHPLQYAHLEHEVVVKKKR